MRWTRVRRQTTGAHADGQAVWSWRQGHFLNYFKGKFSVNPVGPD
jgi:hypothetical protein